MTDQEFNHIESVTESLAASVEEIRESLNALPLPSRTAKQRLHSSLILKELNNIVDGIDDLYRSAEDSRAEHRLSNVDGYEDLHDILPPAGKLTVGAYRDLMFLVRDWARCNGYDFSVDVEGGV